MGRGIATLLAGFSLLAPAPAAADYTDAVYSHTCYRSVLEPEGRGDAGTFGTPLARCTAAGFAERSTGAFGLDSSLVTPGDGTLPGSGYLFADARFLRTFTLAHPAPWIEFEATIHVADSRVERAGPMGDGARMIASTSAHLYGYADCGACDMSAATEITHTDNGPVAVQDVVLVLRGRIAPADRPTVPAGPVYVFVFVETALMTSLPTVGTASAGFTGELVSLTIAA